jgi:hypothetical protein
VLHVNGAWSVALVLSTTDSTGVHTGTLSFTGKLNGTFSSQNANIANMFGTTSPKTLTLGSVVFTVALTSYTPPGPPDQANAGSISAHVTVSNAVGPPPPPPPQNTPEPSTLLLSGLGLTFLGGAAWRKRRQARLSA